jgi:hypothetical protein
MAKKHLSAIGIVNTDIATTPSKGQKAFNALIEQIGKRRAALADWEAFDAVFRRKYNDELVPLRQSYDALRLELVNRLDQSNDIKGLTKGERQTIAELIVQISGDLLASGDHPDIEEVHRRYDTSSVRTSAAHVHDVPAVVITPVHATPPPDEHENESPDDVMRRIQQELDQQEERDRMRHNARADYHARRKTKPKNDAAADRARVEEAEVHLSIRQVYRKLASALHPDRETDPVERERKAAWMQRVNGAYASRSLLDLLEIQLELEHIDQASLDNINEAALKRWNTVLNEQLHGLDQELLEIEADYRARCGMPGALAVSPKSVRRALNTNITHLREAARWFAKDLRAFDDERSFKAWLKDMKAELTGQ